VVEQPPTVMVIDDDPGVRDSLGKLLRSAGFRVSLLGSVSEFLAADRPEGPACLVLDVRLPGQSGLELQRELAGAKRQLPIIFITGHGDIPMSVRAMKAGAVEFLTKPFRDQDLLDAVNAVDDGRDLGSIFDNDIAFSFESVGNVLSGDCSGLNVVCRDCGVSPFGYGIDCHNGNSGSLSFLDRGRNCFRVAWIEDDEIDTCSNKIVDLSKLLSEVIVITENGDGDVRVNLLQFGRRHLGDKDEPRIA